MVGSLAQVLQPTALEAGTLIIGIYDMDYYVHSSFQYHLQVRNPAPARAAPWSTMYRSRCGRPAEAWQEVSSCQRRYPAPLVQVSQQSSKSDENSYTPWISVGVALGCTGIVGFLIFHFHRAHLRRRAGARGLAMWSWCGVPLPCVSHILCPCRLQDSEGLTPASKPTD